MSERVGKISDEIFTAKRPCNFKSDFKIFFKNCSVSQILINQTVKRADKKFFFSDKVTYEVCFFRSDFKVVKKGRNLSVKVKRRNLPLNKHIKNIIKNSQKTEPENFKFPVPFPVPVGVQICNDCLFHTIFLTF